MIKTLIINREDEKEEIKILFGKIDEEWEVKTEPFNMVIEDSVHEMLVDIGCYDFEYLKESIKQNQTGYCITSL